MEDKNQPLRPDKTGTSTSSLGEIEHFSRLAAEWWNPEGSFKSLHQINPIRMAYLCDQICLHFDRKRNHFRSLENLSILDVGCGGGLICEPLARLGANVTGIDGAEESIGVASHHANMMSLNISYQRRLPEELAAKDKQYDILRKCSICKMLPRRMPSFLAIGWLIPTTFQHSRFVEIVQP